MPLLILGDSVCLGMEWSFPEHGCFPHRDLKCSSRPAACHCHWASQETMRTWWSCPTHYRKGQHRQQRRPRRHTDCATLALLVPHPMCPRSAQQSCNLSCTGLFVIEHTFILSPCMVISVIRHCRLGEVASALPSLALPSAHWLPYRPSRDTV